MTPWCRGLLLTIPCVVSCSTGNQAPPPSAPPQYYPAQGSNGTWTQAPPQGPTPNSGTGTPGPIATVPVPVPAPTNIPIPYDPNAPADPIHRVDSAWLQTRARQLHGELLESLPEPTRSHLRPIPLLFDPHAGEVNAYAGCTDSGAVLVVTDELLRISAELSRARAVDELYGAQDVSTYISYVASHQQPEQPMSPPPAGFYSPSQLTDPRVVQRQHQVFDEVVGFVVSHELAHHYLRHLPCTAGNLTVLSEASAIATSVIPALNQPNEVAADTYGVNTLLRAGRAHPEHPWTEVGALVLMSFFQGIDQLSPYSVLFGFEVTHPRPELRAPLIQQTAAAFRLTGGMPLPLAPW